MHVSYLPSFGMGICFDGPPIFSEAMKGSLPLVKVGLQTSDPLYSVLDISRSNIKDISRVTGEYSINFINFLTFWYTFHSSYIKC